jgi:hypothetical protein
MQGRKLSVGIAQINRITVHNGHISNAGAGQEFSSKTAYTTQADDHDPEVFHVCQGFFAQEYLGALKPGRSSVFFFRIHIAMRILAAKVCF